MVTGPDRLRLHRPLDLTLAVVGGLALLPFLAVAVVVASISTRAPGVFRQIRIGRRGEPFTMYKIRTMRDVGPGGTTVTTAADDRITPAGRAIRRTKLDEFPQLINVVRGEMSLIGPRPDVPGFADQLAGDARELLAARPGITGPASILFRDEEYLLAHAADPDEFNDRYLYPMKTRVNIAWLRHGSLVDDLRLLAWTFFRPDVQAVEQLIESWDPGFSQSETYRQVREVIAA